MGLHTHTDAQHTVRSIHSSSVAPQMGRPLHTRAHAHVLHLNICANATHPDTRRTQRPGPAKAAKREVPAPFLLPHRPLGRHSLMVAESASGSHRDILGPPDRGH